ncbi:unnamed protein product, partial [Polarella glacialis]
GRWYYSTGRYDWDDGTPLSAGEVEASSGEEAVDGGFYMNWDQGQPSAPMGEQGLEQQLYMAVSNGKWHDARVGKHSLAIVCQESVAQATGLLRLEGPLGGQVFSATAGRPLVVSGLEGVGLVAADLLLVADLGKSCGTAPAAVKLGGEGISYPSQDGTSFAWPGYARTVGGLYQLCWCRIKANVTDCRRHTDFLVSAGQLVLSGPLLAQRRRCHSGEECNITLNWPLQAPVVPGLLSVASSCESGAAVVAGFQGGPAISSSADFTWPQLNASGGRHKLCWCSMPNCTGPSDHTAIEVGLIE